MEAFDLMLSILYKSSRNFEMNWGPQSEMIVTGIPCLAYTSSRRIFAHPSDESSMLQAMGMMFFEKRSTMTRMASWPLDSGRPVIISTEIWVQGSEGIWFG